MAQKHRMDNDNPSSKALVRDLNSVITCRLCEGYLIDATTLIDCLHYFCRACILRYFENSKTGCPTCNTIYKKKSQACFRSDPQIQSLVYKLVPSLYAKEIQRREDFYRSTGVRASSSCSDDSVIDRERDLINEQEKMISKCVGDKNLFLSPDDSISLSLEYYQLHLDTTNDNEKTSWDPTIQASDDNEPKQTIVGECESKVSDNNQTALRNSDDKDLKTDISDSEVKIDKADEHNSCNKENIDSKSGKSGNPDGDKRYLQCPAAVSMKHLQKFVRMKFGLTADHRVDIIYKGEVLPKDFSLMDVAYTFSWERIKPMRFFYRIFTPIKIRPIKIVNTTLSTGGKLLQIVPVKPTPEHSPKREEHPEDLKKKHDETAVEVSRICTEAEDQKKELFAHLQLKSKIEEESVSKVVPEKPQSKDCVFEYEEPDQEEIKKFAEKRDREWALQKKLDETRKREEDDYNSHHFTKKRKKNKHSKSDFNMHKKRKLHAEIASNDAELKLKVKITNNGHKHKHHKSSGQINGKTQMADSSSKEKLLQMRQVRHKHVSSEDKNVQTVPSIKLSKDTSSSTEKFRAERHSPSYECSRVESEVSTKPYPPNLPEDIKKLKIKVSEPSSKVSESAVLPRAQAENNNTSPKVGTYPEATSSRTSFTVKPASEKESNKKVATVKIERNEQTEKHAQKTFLKPFPANAEKYKVEKMQIKTENAKIKHINNITANKNVRTETKAENNKIASNNKLLERKIASLKQHCTIEPKQPETLEKKLNLVNEKPKFLTPHYPPGFTVSKVEQGVKRKSEDDEGLEDKRPSLEITLIGPPTSQVLQNSKPVEKMPAKRPLPATIPLEKIKKSVNLKSGISIIPKMSERCDNIGALDLSKPGRSVEVTSKNPRLETPNGFTVTSNRQLSALRTHSNSPSEKNMALSNLQMLSKVATEHSSLNNKSTSTLGLSTNKPKPQMPSLQTLKIPLQQSQGPMKTNLQKLPKLNEIQKFRPTNLQIRNMRPNPNQNIRNIPNPSLLIRQQNQNRLNSQISIQPTETSSAKSVSNVSSISTPAAVSITTVSKETTPTSAVTALKLMESKVQEKKEISV